MNSGTVGIDIPVPEGFRVKEKDVKKMGKYQGLTIEINKQNLEYKYWSGLRGSVSSNGAQYKFDHFVVLIGVNQWRSTIIHQTALLRSTHILRKVGLRPSKSSGCKRMAVKTDYKQ